VRRARELALGAAILVAAAPLIATVVVVAWIAERRRW
jgi:hypothetical protein